MPCEFSEKLVEFQMGLLDGAEADAVADHLFEGSCEECKAELRRIGPVVLGLQGLRARHEQEQWGQLIFGDRGVPAFEPLDEIPDQPPITPTRQFLGRLLATFTQRERQKTEESENIINSIREIIGAEAMQRKPIARDRGIEAILMELDGDLLRSITLHSPIDTRKVVEDVGYAHGDPFLLVLQGKILELTAKTEGEYLQASQVLQTAIELLQDGHDRRTLVIALNERAVALRMLPAEHRPAALATLFEAERYASELANNRGLLFICYKNILDLCRIQSGDTGVPSPATYEIGREHYSALILAAVSKIRDLNKEPYPRERALALDRLGLTVLTEDPEAAVAFHDEALALHSRDPRRPDIALSTEFAASARAQVIEKQFAEHPPDRTIDEATLKTYIDQAFALYEETRKLEEELGRPQGIARVTMRQGVLRYLIGDHEAAASLFVHAESSFRGVYGRSQAVCLSYMIRNLVETDYQIEDLRFRVSQLAEVWNELGKGEKPRYRKYLQEACTILERASQFDERTEIAKIMQA